jgi:tetratricopeptide (TPR) repeat protein
MKKYLAVVAVFIIAASFIIIKYNKTAQADYTIKERKTPSAEWATTKATANRLFEAIKKDAADNKSRLALAALFIQEARVTGDYSYYDAAAMKYVGDVLKQEPVNFEALIYKAIIQLSQHHFADGLATAQQAQKINPYNAFVYGIMVDANVELGNYAAAVENSDKMVSIRPDLRSYSRIAYLREIHGDIPGAIEAMKLAVEAGMPGQEGTEWCRVQLGQLYEHSGDFKHAQMQYEISLEERPNYAYALAGQARIAMANKDYEKAAGHYIHAYDMVNDQSFREKLAEMYEFSGQHEKAVQLGNEVIKQMTKNAATKLSDSVGHYSDRELAYAYLAVNNTGKALEHALMEYNRRPDNIDVNETVAWVYYRRGEFVKGLPYIKAALRTNCKNPSLLAHAGLIYLKAGRKDVAVNLLSAALAGNISPVLKAECVNALKA